MKKAVLIYPHQLFEHHPALEKDAVVFLVEDPPFFTQYRFHKQKILFHRASMQAYKILLEEQGYTVVYGDCADIKKTEAVAMLLHKHGITTVSWCDPVDNWLSKKVAKALAVHNIACVTLDTPLFLTTQKTLDTFFLPLIAQDKKFLMKSFYEWQRKRLSVLLDTKGKPVGGKWSYDTDNRKKLPKTVMAPEDPTPNDCALVCDARAYTEKHFADNYGTTEAFFYPVTHGQAKHWLDTFLKERLADFGPYEDAMTTRGSVLFHSVLSPLLNAGLLTPQYVLEKTIAFSEQHEVPLSSLEGFIRQLIGWREYIRAVYVYKGTAIRKGNYFHAHRSIPASFWQGTTGLVPVDDTIATVLRYGYAHHIPRLMVMGNIMNLCGFDPDEVYRWFMELFIDAYDWVMVPNVYSMALYADGGVITTKPYISGSAYILGMSDYKKGAWSEIWDGLFWHFVGIHFEKLSKEGRLGFIGITYQKMSAEKKAHHEKVAKQFLQSQVTTRKI